MTILALSTAQWVITGVAIALALGGFGLVGKTLREMMKIRTAKGQHRPLIGKPPQVTRRSFFGRAMMIGFGLAMLDFAAASLAFLWPVNKGGFGGKITLAQSSSDIKAQIRSTKLPFYFAPGRFYLVEYGETNADAKKLYIDNGIVADGLMALYQRCVHLGCRVPFCQASQWFECPCHGSKYSRAGEYRLGPAPRGLDRFSITVTGGIVTVDTGSLHIGPPRGTNTTGQNPEGPFCVGAVSTKH